MYHKLETRWKSKIPKNPRKSQKNPSNKINYNMQLLYYPGIIES